MGNDAWREEVALLLQRCAESLRANKDRSAAADLGAALAYIQRADEHGEKGATILMAQMNGSAGLDQTKRFTFAPGELEELESQSTRAR